MLATFTGGDGHRGTQILRATDALGPYEPWSDGPVTPDGWACLDGTLHIDDAGPWLVFCHEFIQCGDGEVCAMPLTADLRTSAGDAVRLFGPLGSAVFEPSLGLDLLLAVGGSGLAPALSILARAAHDGYLGRHAARLFLGIRSLQDATALPQISAWAERFGAAFEATVVLSDVAATATEQARWPAAVSGAGPPPARAGIGRLNRPRNRSVATRCLGEIEHQRGG